MARGTRVVRPNGVMLKDSICSVEECELNCYKGAWNDQNRALCKLHATRWLRTGDPTGVKSARGRCYGIDRVADLDKRFVASLEIGILTDDMILGDVEVIKDGTIMGNRFYVRYEGDDDCTNSCGCPTPTPPDCACPCPGFAESSEQFCYGSIERLITGIPAQDEATADEVAQEFLALSKIAPRLIELPTGTRLSPETPWGINDMIPGQRVDVALTSFCFPVFQSFRLTGVSVSDNGGGEEEITIDLEAVESTASS